MGKVTEMLYYVLQPSAGEEENPASLERLEQQVLSGKVRAQLSSDSLSMEQKSVVQFAAGLHDQGSSRRQSSESHEALDPEDRDRIRKKVRTVARMARMMKMLRQENETIVQLKGVCPGHKLKPGMLLAGKDKLESELQRFNHACELDAENEIRPEGGPS